MTKSKGLGRGGARPGAGRRPRHQTPVPPIDPETQKSLLVELAMGGIERALKSYESGSGDCFTPVQRRWHIAMLLLGVPPETIGPALLKPGVSLQFRDSVLAAIDAVNLATRG